MSGNWGDSSGWSAAIDAVATHASIEADEEVLSISFEARNANAKVGRGFLPSAGVVRRTHQAGARVSVDLGIAYVRGR